MSQYNLIVLGDLIMNSHVHGRTIICGSYTDVTAGVFGDQLTNTDTGPKNLTLQINGGFNSSGDNNCKVQRGSMLISNPPYRNVAKVDNIKWSINNRQVTLNGGNEGAEVFHNSSINGTCVNMTNALIALSQDLANRSMSRNVIKAVDNKINCIVNETDCNGVAVFNANANDTWMIQNSKDFFLVMNIPNVTFVVLNIWGKNISSTNAKVDQGSMCSSSLPNGCGSVLWNFLEATTLLLTMDQGYGSMLAPYASSGSAQNVNFNGAIVMKSPNLNAETHFPLLVPPPCRTNCV